jgi:tetratricopeptide (TPR) repeat protein
MGVRRSSVGWMLAIALLGAAVPVLGLAEGAIAQAQVSDQLQKAIDEGTRLLREGSKASLTAAISQFEQALKLSQAEGQKAQRAVASLRLGRTYDSLGEKTKALEFFNQALPLYRAVGDRGGEATTLNNIGRVYSALGQKPKALKFYNQALPLYRAVGNRGGEATTLNNIGSVYSDVGEKSKALEFYTQVLPLLRAVGDRRGEATTLNNIGRVYSALGQKTKALDFYNQALPLRRAVGDQRGEATTLNNIGRVYKDLGEKPKALEFYNQALPLYQAVGDRGGEATTLNNIGIVYSDLGQKPKALEFYNQALPLYQAVGDRGGEASTLNNIGRVYDALGEKLKALDFYNQALPLYRAVGDRDGEANTLNNIGYLFNSQKQPELAIVFYKQSVNVYESLRDSNRTLPHELRESQTKSFSYTYQYLSDLLIKQGRLPEAQAVLELLQLKELREYTRDASTPNHGISLAPTEQAAFDAVLKQYGSINKFATEVAQCELKQCPTLTALQTKRDKFNSITSSLLDRLRTTLTIQALDLSQLKTEDFNNKARDIVNAQPDTILVYPIVQEHNIQFLIAVKAGKDVILRPIDGPTIEQDKLLTVAAAFRNQLSSPYSLHSRNIRQ